VDHVLVVPDGALQVVSLATLLTDAGSTSWMRPSPSIT
jgi:hypothetical protein